MEKFEEIDLKKLSYRKQIEMKWYPNIKWIYVKFYSIYGYYWAYKLFNKNYELPYWEQWTLWIFAMLSLYFLLEKKDLIISLIMQRIKLKKINKQLKKI